ncbi:hydratase [Mesorhizobium sp. B283B1A]|uniref:2-keto-4-pentenoate hydratase n=1 Tax=Mesorhizobium TaxID=68287 RepID=UPI001CD12E27|nr:MULTISPECIES: hydratase [Mesorhizobium]MCA0051447.1 hydratase [Mesorhizobium sp. B283B1A]UQS66485.1 hydratase [Mesorhizobium opportunistum]
MSVSDETLAKIADEVFDTMAAPREVSPFSERFPGFGLEDSYRIVNEIRRRREARGERVVGRKIGFTNAAAWAGYGISGPIWNYLYDATTSDLKSGSTFSIGGWPNVRMETEVALGLSEAPDPSMEDIDLLHCVEWAALDFEICTSIFPDWRFKVSDAAATGVHVALLLGVRHPIGETRKHWADELETFSVTLSEAAGAHATGGGAQVLGSPIKALRHLVRQLALYGGEPLVPGEVVTTGTLTQALPAVSCELWRASVKGAHFGDIEVRLT